ncbi:MAG: 4Fe-4S binding protein [Porphyromonadaceae bacterium]|nr:4Fe-4S binding protein [Porphyromonadaceae bacterium]
MLRKIRIVVAVVCFVLITLLFLDFTGVMERHFGWLAKIQLLPALLALNVVVILVLAIVTLLCGRIYCSIICPLGVLQDGISHLAGRRKKYRFHYRKGHPLVRYVILAVYAVILLLGITPLAALLAPYSAYGRIASAFFAPIYRSGNNLIARIAEQGESYAFYRTDIGMTTLPVYLIAAVTLIVLAVVAWRWGRAYCNTVCPVGTLLGLLSRYALLRPVINVSACTGCGLCAKDCKASCIDPKEHRIDYSRCVACMDCLDACRQKAITFSRVTERQKTAEPSKEEPISKVADQPKKPTDRRQFLVTAGLLAAGALQAQERKVDGGLAPILDKKVPQRATPIVPPGAQGLRHLHRHCTACQLCVQACPNGVLRPSTRIESLMQPEASYEKGYCRPECTRCSEVCPTGAILRIDRAEKSSIQIGHAVWIAENCIPLTDGVECGNCARHCPVEAIVMVQREGETVRTPVVEEERCIGCGACENLCPARPFSAIYVEGHVQHRTI